MMAIFVWAVGLLTAWPAALLDVLLSPALWLSVALALVYALLFFLWHDESWQHLTSDIAASLLGFAAGHMVATWLGIVPWPLSAVQIVPGTLAALLALLIGGRWRRRQVTH